MARITRVKKAQQRYKTRPVLDAENKPIRDVLTDRRTGKPKVDKRGRVITVARTVRDTDHPLPMPTCDYCHETIEVGQAYKWVDPKNGYRRNRHAHHPDWQPWDLSSSLSAQLARISYDAYEAAASAESPDDVQSALDDAAQAIRDLAEEKREAASNIEDGFGHPTYQSEELNETAEALDSWAEEVESADIPDLPEPEDADDEDEDAEPSEDQMDDWRSEVETALSIIDETPV